MPPAAKKASYRFTFGPWNISTGADPFGPPVRKEVAFAAKIREYKKLGFDGVQCHDDDVVPPDQIDSDPTTLMKAAARTRKVLEGEGLFCEFVAPRLWEHGKTIDGAYTSNSASERKYAIPSTLKLAPIDIANAVGCKGHRPLATAARRYIHPRGQGSPCLRRAHPRRRQRRARLRQEPSASWAK